MPHLGRDLETKCGDHEALAWRETAIPVRYCTMRRRRSVWIAVEFFIGPRTAPALELDIPNAHDVRLHFDLYNHILGTNRGVFAPFSHDADGTTRYLPGPSVFVGLCSMGLTALGLFRRRRGVTPG